MKGVCDNGVKLMDLFLGFYEMFSMYGTIDFSSTDIDNECTMEFGENLWLVWICKENDFVIVMFKDGFVYMWCGCDVVSVFFIKY